VSQLPEDRNLIVLGIPFVLKHRGFYTTVVLALVHLKYTKIRYNRKT